MPDESRLLELVMRWEELREEGHNPSAAELCQDCPELLPALQERLAALEAMNVVLDSGEEKQVSATSRLGEPGKISNRPISTEQAAVSSAGSVPTIGSYEVLRELGRGGMGVVYLVRQAGTERVVALKMLLADRRAMSGQRERFEAEVQALLRLQHPNVVQVLEVGEHKGQPYFTMEYLDGGTLQDRIGSRPQTPRYAAELVEILARAIHAAHQRRIVHRDLKPANVLLTAKGTPKIGDFGLARRLSVMGRLTRAMHVLGTPGYMAPEQAAGQSREAGPASDIYALGAIFYQMLTGRPPFQGKSDVELVRQAAEEAPMPPRHWESTVPVELEVICLKCLHKQAEHRYPTAAALADDLRRYLDPKTILARPKDWWRRLSQWARARARTGR